MTVENMELNLEETDVTQETNVTEENTNTLEDTDMNNTEVLYVKEIGYLERNKAAVGAAAGAGVAGLIGGFFAGSFREKKKNQALMNAIVEEIANFSDVHEGRAEGIIEETYAFRNAKDIKFKILEKIENQKISTKEKQQWLDLLDMVMEIAVIGRETQIITEREIVQEVKVDKEDAQ